MFGLEDFIYEFSLLCFATANQENPIEDVDMRDLDSKKGKIKFLDNALSLSLTENIMKLMEKVNPTTTTISFKKIIAEESPSPMYKYDSESEEEDHKRVKIEERKVGDYECKECILSTNKKNGIARPWKKWVIMKVLGRKVGYKALKHRLNLMWAKQGVFEHC